MDETLSGYNDNILLESGGLAEDNAADTDDGPSTAVDPPAIVASCPATDFSDWSAVWKSTLQDSISTSTMMAEYYALSAAMREVLPLRNLVTTVANALGINDMINTTFRCAAHEDNVACETLANPEPRRVTPRSKFYDVKVHWFHSTHAPSATGYK